MMNVVRWDPKERTTVEDWGDYKFKEAFLLNSWKWMPWHQRVRFSLRYTWAMFPRYMLEKIWGVK